jgi:FdhD protein
MMMNHEYQVIPLQRLENEDSNITSECIVQESIIVLHCLNMDGEVQPYTTLLGTPTAIKELHAGHLFCEGLTRGTPLLDLIHGETVDGKVNSYYNSIIIDQPENRLVTTSCGACNHPDLTVDHIHGIPNSISENLSHSELLDALDFMRSKMDLFQKTGGCHGAALLDSFGMVTSVSEDIGRHNAVDKTIGQALFSGISAFEEYTLLLSGRCGWDIVAKATRIGISSIASVGAFSSAALELARANGISLYGFVRESGAWKAGIN